MSSAGSTSLSLASHAARASTRRQSPRGLSERGPLAAERWGKADGNSAAACAPGCSILPPDYDYNTLPAPPTSAELAAYWRPYIEPCIEAFGARRCAFESNFPVDKMGIGYRALWNAFKRIAAEASLAEKVALFSDTARHVYRLG